MRNRLFPCYIDSLFPGGCGCNLKSAISQTHNKDRYLVDIVFPVKLP